MLVFAVTLLSMTTTALAAPLHRGKSDPLAVRQHIVEILTALPDLVPGHEAYAETTRALKVQAERLTPEELAQFAVVDDAQLQQFAQRLEARAARAREHSATGRMHPASDVVGPAVHPLPDLNYDPICGGTPGDTASEQATIDGLAIASAAEIVAEGVASLTVIAGEGSNAPQQAAVAVLKGTVLAIQTSISLQSLCDGYIAFQESHITFTNLYHLHDDLARSVTNDDQNKAALSDQLTASTTSIVNNANANATTIQNNDNSNRNQIITNATANRDQILANQTANRDQIMANDTTNKNLIIAEMRTIGCELDRLLNTSEGKRSSSILSCSGQPGYPYKFGSLSLAPVKESIEAPAEDDRGQNGVAILPMLGTVTLETSLIDGRMIPSYYLPASRGGMLEQVKTLVWSTIDAQLALNIVADRTEQARVIAFEADRLFVQQQYVDAYRKYASAYRQLIPLPVPPADAPGKAVQ